jgi:outer membrane protein TolC
MASIHSHQRRNNMNKGIHSFRSGATIATFILMLVPLASSQERRITLQEAMDLALRQNHALQIAHYEVAAQLEKQRSARSNYFPNITNESNALYITNLQRIQVPPGAFGAIPGGPLIPSSTEYLTQGEKALQSSGTMVAQPITQLIKIHQSNKIAAAELGVSKASLKKTSTDVIYSVHELYYRLLTTQLQRKAAELQITSSNEGLAESREQYKDGSLLPAALVESRADALQAKQVLLTADMQISDLMVQLNDVLGLPLDTKLVPDPEVDTVFDLPTREQSLDMASKDNPEVQKAIHKLAAARAAEAAAKAEYIPDITGYGRYSYQNGVPFVDHNFGTFGIHLTYDLFDAGRRNALVRERRDEVSEAAEILKRTRDEVGVQITTAYNKLETTRAMVDVAREYLAARQETNRISEDQFKQGALLKSQRDGSHAQTMKAQAGLLEASLDYLLARDELSRILGHIP